MCITDNLKTFFKSNRTEKVPQGICPNCWGKQDWDGHHYKFMKGNNGNPSDETYNTFIQDVARKLDKIELSKDTYTCATCTMKYK